MKTGRDIKFVIYQVLYIFVVCVIALKGADINLEEVLNKADVEPKKVVDELRRKLDSLMALDTTIKSWDTTKIYSETDLQKILASYELKDNIEKPRDIAKNDKTNDGPTFTSNNPPPISTGVTSIEVPEFTQYTVSSVRNPYEKNLEVFADGNKIATIPPKGTGQVKVNGESNIRFEVEGKSGSKPTKEKQPPKIDIQKFISDGEDASLRSIQGRVGYRVTVVSSYAGDLNVNISGPVRIDKVSPTQFDITLNLLASESAFEGWSKGKTEPYKANFTVSVKDKYNPKQSISQIGVFTFGKW
jgi:hypothetical protein